MVLLYCLTAILAMSCEDKPAVTPAPTAENWATANEGAEEDPSSGFDISGVDTNFPEFDCSLVHYDDDCESWAWGVEHGVDGVVGSHSTTPVIGEGTLYIQLRREPHDLEGFERDKATMLALKPAEWHNVTWVVIPVKHTYPDLWRWAEILDRFAQSEGNTIGMILAWHTDNSTSGARLGLYRNADTGRWHEGRGEHKADLLRSTIRVRAVDAHVVREALPVLLPELGIPLDAVTVILEHDPDGTPTATIG